MNLKSFQRATSASQSGYGSKSRLSVFAACVEALELRTHLTSVVATTPLNGAQTFAPASNVNVTFDVPLDPASVNASTVQLRDASNTIVPAVLSISNTQLVTINPVNDLAVANSYYFVTIKGGVDGVKDTGGSPLPSSYTFSFTTGTPSFTETAVFSGLVSPTSVQFAPDGRIFIAEKSGIVKEFDNLNDTTPTIVVDLRVSVHNFWDRGLLGLALDPQFTTGRPFMYLLYTYDADIGGVAPKWGTTTSISDGGGSSPTGTGANVSGRLSRVTVGPDNVGGAETVLINDWANQFPSHSVGHIEFGPDGALYASAGDGASFGATDYGQFGNPFNDPVNEGGALRAQDVLSAGDPTSLDGTIIRINPDTGLAAAGNPVNSTELNRNRIIAHGFRNPFRFTFRPGTSELWLGDVGWNSYEEIDKLDTASLTSQKNYGWPAYEGGGRQGGYAALNLPLLQGIYAQGAGAVVSPFYWYGHAAKVVANSSEPTGGSSVTGISFYDRGTYPSAYDGALFFSDYSRKQLYVMYKGPDGQPDPKSAQIFRSLTRGAVQLKAGPGGDLFYVDLDGGRVVRITNNNVGNNTAPTAVITSTSRTGATPLTVNFSALSSTDPDAGDVLTYAWDLNGDGQYDDSTSATPSFTYTTPGDRTVRLRATDRAGATSVTTVSVSVANTAPVPVILTPSTSLRWSVGDLVDFSGGATDAEDGVLPATSLNWDLVLIHANALDPTSTHTHVIESYAGVATGSFQTPDHDYPSWLELRLTATDAYGTSATTTMRLDPKTVQLNFSAVPVGLSLGFNGELVVAPFSRTVIANSTNTISAPPQTLNGQEWVFQNWSDGKEATHDVSAPQTDTNYAANFYVPRGTQSPFNGTPAPIPGRIEAEDFDRGGQDVAYYDTSFENNGAAYRPTERVDLESTTDTLGGGYNVGWLEPGEWIEYTTNVAQAGKYTMLFRVGTGQPDALFHLEVDGVNVTDSVPIPQTSWVDYTTISKSGITISAGTHKLRFYAESSSIGGLGNFNWMQFVKEPDPVPTAPTTLSVVAISSSSTRLTWTDNASNETGYQIERRRAADTAFTLVTTVGANVTTYDDTSVTYSTSYVYRVRAVGEGATPLYSVYSNDATVTTPLPPAPAAPTVVVATARGIDSAIVSWSSNVPLVDSFIVQRQQGTTGTWTTVATVAGSARSFVNTGLSAATSYNYRVQAVRATLKSAFSNTAAVTTWTRGDGLSTRIFNNANFTGQAVDRITPQVDFNFGLGSPAAGIDPDTFSIRWTGQIRANFSETYTFIAAADDGVRVWVNNTLIIDKWQVQAARDNIGTINMTAGQKVNLKIEYYDNTSYASCKFYWSSPSVPRAIVPSHALFSTTPVALTTSTLKTSSATAPLTTTGATSTLKTSAAVL